MQRGFILGISVRWMRLLFGNLSIRAEFKEFLIDGETETIAHIQEALPLRVGPDLIYHFPPTFVIPGRRLDEGDRFMFRLHK